MTVPRVSPLPPVSLGATARTRIRRHSDRALAGLADLHAVLDAGLVAHVGFVIDGGPVVLPMAYARDGDRLLLHGSSRNRMLRAVADGAELCLTVTVTVLDGLVLGATALAHSMNYRSAVVYGRACALTDGPAKARALGLLVDWLTGRQSAIRILRCVSVSVTECGVAGARAVEPASSEPSGWW